MGERLGRIDRLHFPANGRNQIARILFAAHDEDAGGIRILRPGHIHFRLRVFVEAPVFNVADNADNRDPDGVLLFRIAECDPFSESVLVRPIFFRERLIDDDNGRRSGGIGFGKEATFLQWRLQDAEVVGRNFAIFLIGERIGIRVGSSFDRRKTNRCSFH